MKAKRALGIAIREARKAHHKLSQEQLGYLCGLDRTYISLLELGRKSPTVDALTSIADALGVRASTLLKRMEELTRARHG